MWTGSDKMSARLLLLSMVRVSCSLESASRKVVVAGPTVSSPVCWANRMSFDFGTNRLLFHSHAWVR